MMSSKRIPGPRHEASIMVFAFPWLWGLPLLFAGRGAARWGGYRFCAFVVMCRAALRRVRAAAACAFGVYVALAGPWAQLSIIVRAPRGGLVERRRRRLLPSVVGDWDVCGRMVAFLGAKVTIRRVSCSRCRMTSPSTGRALLARSGRAFAISRGVFEQLALPVSSSSHDC